MIHKKPYLIIPKLIEQPTWGGNYISLFKNLNLYSEKKIGQSYELFGGSKLLMNNAQTTYEVCNTPPSEKDRCDIADGTTIYALTLKYPSKVLGPTIQKRFAKMPLLIKFTQSLGNSFQLHVKKKDENTRWKPKPESWYFFEDGLITFGLRNKIDINAYKNCCLFLNGAIQKIANKVANGILSFKNAKKHISELTRQNDPYQFVNCHRVKRGFLVDLSEGGLHHSWEEDATNLPHGNIVYEVQVDVDDHSSTLRSFDKGRIKKNGTIRTLSIEDYFQYIDTNPTHNDIRNAIQHKKDERLLTTKNYSLDELFIQKQRKEYIEDSFVHLFVKDGSVTVVGPEGEVNLQRGASCFIPFFIKSYTLVSQTTTSTVLKTHILF